ncbi:SDR family NAD(P)-dependent oxidoreductase [Fibrella forsythiae]|uniref:Glucose 1-dehydrogenase n=1 Tax=Fibrella forsythiae TaxID=2817061 RepID=A0ABS3JKU7_9BACT|nr:glucose 1-dehydrogenase [Fibrella forsythiae]MBO0950026.1 glucose 1-dehydrogenase [Fibrella forsythiae]
MSSFNKQVVLITGAGSGIGRATALAFAQAGARIVVSDVNGSNGQQTVELIRQAGGEATYIHCDVADPEQHTAAVAFAVGTFGRLDVAVNNAGIGGRFARLIDQTVSDWEQMMAVNLGSVFYGLQAQIRQMVQQPEGGRIVNVSSIAGVKGMPMGAPYSAAKHGVIGLTKTAALEYVKKNIRVNAICPVYTHSAMVQELMSTAPEMEERMRRVIPMGRFGQPEEIAQAIMWLCAPENDFCTGQAIQMDGGMTAG